jgi:two-component system OmpR family sensor kinase
MSRAPVSPDDRLVRRTALRIGRQTAAGMAVTVLVLAAIAVLVVLRGQHTADDELIDTAIARADDVTDPPAGIWLVIRSAGDQVTSPGLPSGLPAAGELDRTAADRASRRTDLRLGDREYRVDTRPYGGDGAIQAVLDLSAEHGQRFRLLKALMITGAAGLLLAAALSVWLARRAVTPLAQALALQRRFVADAGHELRTPLTLLSTRAQLIRRSLGHDRAPSALASDVDGLVRDARQLSAILDDLLMVADPRSPVTGPVALTTLVRDATEAARPAAQSAGIDLRLSTMDPPVTVRGSEAGLRRAVTALLDNAIRHAGSEVTVVVAEHRGSATVEITDDGPGIDPSLLPTLFDRFAGATTENPRGPRRHGLGLALVSEIAARHGGTIDVQPVAGGGARFRLTLPAGSPKRRDVAQHPPTA